MSENNKADRDKMKSLAFGMASDLSRVLADQGFGDTPIDIVEALAFAMFIIADTYSLARPDKERAIEIIHRFYDDMQDHLINKIIIQDHNLTDAAETEAAAAKFHDLSRGRFHEYGAKFKEDISDPMAMSCPNMVSYLLDNLFIEPIAKEEKLKLMAPVSDKVLFFWSGCVQAFKC
ncbi:MAG: hypothetical protein C4567_08755 [Deltaproteobacteria bacterium]|nr:MAG: hypothetical protein C4567_08755 [Deltaproteobacteria bacterium]